MICTDCSGASDWRDGRPLTPDRAAAVKEVLTLVGVVDPDLQTYDDEQKAQAITLLHQRCEERGSCTCQHGRYLEMDPDPSGFQGYLDALPADDPRRLAYEKRVGRKIAR